MNSHWHYLIEASLALALVGAALAIHAVWDSLRSLERHFDDLWDHVMTVVPSQNKLIGIERSRIDTLAANTKLRLEALSDRVSRANEWLVSCHDLTGTVSRNDVDGSWTCGCGFGEARIQATEDTAYAAIQGFRAHAYRRKLEQYRRVS